MSISSKELTMGEGGLRLTTMPTVRTAMLIRKPPRAVFEALVDPEITTKVWFTRSTGRLAPGAEVEWSWDMYGVSAPVRVKEFEQDSRLVVELGDPPEATTVEWQFERRDDDTTYVTVTVLEAGITTDDGDAVVAWALDQVDGYTEVLAVLKALLEHDIVLTLVPDRWPDGHPGLGQE